MDEQGKVLQEVADLLRDAAAILSEYVARLEREQPLAQQPAQQDHTARTPAAKR